MFGGSGDGGGHESLNLVEAPAKEPISLGLAKKHLRIDFDTDDEYLEKFVIPTARQRLETETGRQFLPAIWEYWLDRFPGRGALGMGIPYGMFDGSYVTWGDWLFGGWSSFIDIPRPPLQQVLFLNYIDPTGALQTWDPSNYQVCNPQGPTCPRARIKPVYGQTWPLTLYQMDVVTIRFQAGYPDGDLPMQLKHAMLLVIGDIYEHREDTSPSAATLQSLPSGVLAIVSQYRARPVKRSR